ncbi:NYN domain-containing protein [Helicobacter kayseriensis]|uniref:NYN domain-containing protein n=1 Tax=Helicobacter kayseriensis TaxID=2905877 RepID=UPI001E385680|nr:NYN domain-containing protein [Helicobacter kayseriensis]MCE3046853.1 NYN domain-containing protein [Helicobacter kayseriensis]MCE3047845.1 NYN domain-containing protein [Helicobacter kayseriensis]
MSQKMREERGKKVALFIDSENISHRLISEVMERLEGFGEICIKKAYGDWRKNDLRGWDEWLSKYSIEPVHLITGNGIKTNSSDIKIAIDVMNTLFSERMDCIALVTSDSDFAPLAQEIRTRGIVSIGFGEAKSRESLRNAFTSFEEVGRDKEEDLSSNRYLINLLRQATESTMGEDGKSMVSRVGIWLKDHYYKSASSYGRETWGEVFRALDEHFEVTYGGRDNKVMFVEYTPKKRHYYSRRAK